MKNLKVAAAVAALLVAGNAQADYTANIAKLSANPVVQTANLAATTAVLSIGGYQLYQAWKSGQVQAAEQTLATTVQTSINNAATSIASLTATDEQVAAVSKAIATRTALKAIKS